MSLFLLPSISTLSYFLSVPHYLYPLHQFQFYLPFFSPFLFPSILSPFFDFSLGTLWPTLSDGIILGLDPFIYVVLIVCIPYGITGLTLLFPRVSLASYAAEDKVTKICLTLNSAVSALVRGFCAADFADLYTAEVTT